MPHFILKVLGTSWNAREIRAEDNFPSRMRSVLGLNMAASIDIS